LSGIPRQLGVRMQPGPPSQQCPAVVAVRSATLADTDVGVCRDADRANIGVRDKVADRIRRKSRRE
jgi:hypothetical protein